MNDYNAWLLIFMVMSVAEIILPSMGAIGFAFGAIVLAIITYFSPEMFTMDFQIVMFAISSVLSIYLMFKFVYRKKGEDVSDGIVGGYAIVTKVPNKDNLYYQVKYSGTIWNATTAGNCDIGRKVLIESVTGNVLSVTTVSEDLN